MTEPALEEEPEPFARLVSVMDRLRSPGGCPWDGAQTHESLVRYLIEEAYELAEAIETGDAAHVREELGDVLLQVVFHARIAAERDRADGGYDIDDVVTALNDKLVSRHPHVFDETGAGGSSMEDLHTRWERLKRAEKPERVGPFDGIPPALPALAAATKTITKARRAGLDRQGLDRQTTDEQVLDEQTLGEGLFALAERAVAAGIDPEQALRRTTRAYRDRLGSTDTAELG